MVGGVTVLPDVSGNSGGGTSLERGVTIGTVRNVKVKELEAYVTFVV